MTEGDAAKIADRFIAEQVSAKATRTSVRRTHAGEWTALYTITQIGMLDAIVDGPTVVTVNERTGTACFLS